MHLSSASEPLSGTSYWEPNMPETNATVIPVMFALVVLSGIALQIGWVLGDAIIQNVARAFDRFWKAVVAYSKPKPVKRGRGRPRKVVA